MTTQDPKSQIVSPSETNTVEQFTFLDLLLVIVDNLRLLVLGPLLMGLIAFFGVTLMPKTYESTAILKAEQGIASLMNSASVLDPIAVSMGYTQKLDMDEARLKIKKQIQVQLNPKEKMLTLNVKAKSPEAAQALAQAVLNQTYVKSRPRDSERNRLQRQLEQAKAREKEAYETGQLLRKKMDQKGVSVSADAAQGYAQMIRTVQESQAAQFEIEQQMIGLDASALIQEATLPTRSAENQRGLIAVLVVQAVGFLLLIWVLIFNYIKLSRNYPDSYEKIKKLKISFRKVLYLND